MTDNCPLVTVICVCYNHERFVEECLHSVLAQHYPAIEIIVVDDASTDRSVSVIRDLVVRYPQIHFITLPENSGNCTAFNTALKLARGKYVIDLATDDVLLPDRIEKQVAAFEQLDVSYAVVFTDCEYIDPHSRIIDRHYPRDSSGQLLIRVPQGDIYRYVLDRSCAICTPTMMMRKSVLDELGGYDEALSYEDFDFWIRSSRYYKYFYLDEILTRKRVVKGSHSEGFYTRRHNRHLVSTLHVCRKAALLNLSQEENCALARSVRYHLRLSLYTENFELVPRFASLLSQLVPLHRLDRVFMALARVRVPVSGLYRLYFKLRYRFHK